MGRKKYKRISRKYKKRGRGVPYIYNNRVYFGKKTAKRNLGSFISCKTSFKRRWRPYWTLMVKKYTFGLSIKKNQREKIKKTRQRFQRWIKVIIFVRKTVA